MFHDRYVAIKRKLRRLLPYDSFSNRMRYSHRLHIRKYSACINSSICMPCNGINLHHRSTNRSTRRQNINHCDWLRFRFNRSNVLHHSSHTFCCFNNKVKHGLSSLFNLRIKHDLRSDDSYFKLKR